MLIRSVKLTFRVNLEVLQAVGAGSLGVEVFPHARRTFVNVFDVARVDTRQTAVDGVVEQRTGAGGVWIRQRATVEVGGSGRASV